MNFQPSQLNRCHDRCCAVSSTCTRWVRRETKGPGVTHSFTLRALWRSHDAPCEHYQPETDVLTYTELLALLEQGVIEGSDPSLVNPASIDVRLGDTLLVEETDLFGRRLVDIAAGERPPMEVLPLDADGTWELAPGEFALAATLETFNLPLDLAAEFRLKSSGARSGLDAALAMWCDPGWHGSALTLELKNNLQSGSLVLKPGMKIGQMIFLRGLPVPEEHSYAKVGRYNGDRSVQESRGVK
jgi:dCTP deaminase